MRPCNKSAIALWRRAESKKIGTHRQDKANVGAATGVEDFQLARSRQMRFLARALERV